LIDANQHHRVALGIEGYDIILSGYEVIYIFAAYLGD
jgi:hypothetical protein